MGATSLRRTILPEPCGFLPSRLRIRARLRKSPHAHLWSVLPLLAAIAMSAHPAAAEPTPRDLQLLARALGFLERPPRGTAEVGIVYPQRSAEGMAEATRIAASFGDGLRAGNLLVRPRLVPLESVGEARLAALLLTDAAAAQAALVARVVAGRSILTVAVNRALIDAGSVVMVVRSEPRVEVLVNRAAAQTAGVSFAAAFRMMIQER